MTEREESDTYDYPEGSVGRYVRERWGAVRPASTRPYVAPPAPRRVPAVEQLPSQRTGDQPGHEDAGRDETTRYGAGSGWANPAWADGGWADAGWDDPAPFDSTASDSAAGNSTAVNSTAADTTPSDSAPTRSGRVEDSRVGVDRVEVDRVDVDGGAPGRSSGGRRRAPESTAHVSSAALPRRVSGHTVRVAGARTAPSGVLPFPKPAGPADGLAPGASIDAGADLHTTNATGLAAEVAAPVVPTQIGPGQIRPGQVGAAPDGDVREAIDPGPAGAAAAAAAPAPPAPPGPTPGSAPLAPRATPPRRGIRPATDGPRSAAPTSAGSAPASPAPRAMPVQSMPAQSMPAQSMPAQSMPAQSMPAQVTPAQSIPAQAALGHRGPERTMPPSQAVRGSGRWTDPGAVAAQEAQRARSTVDGFATDLSSARLLRPTKRPPQTGWRRALYLLSLRLINPGESPAEQYERMLTARANQPLRGCYKIAMLSLKGGVGKTTMAATLGATFASLRGDRVVAVDANPDRGTLSQKIPLETSATVRHLLRDAQRLRRYTDVRAYTSQGPSRLEVLASEQDPAVSEAFSEDDYRRTVNLLEHFYNIVLTDCGTGLMHSAMYGVLGVADQLIIVSSGSIDGARSASATMDWLDAHGHGDLVRNSVVVINCVHRSAGGVDLDRVAAHFAARCRAVVRVPFDAHLEEGAELDLDRIAPETRLAMLELAAAVADAFEPPSPPHR